MSKPKWAHIVMNEGYDPERHRARFDTEIREGHMLTVRNPAEAVELAKKLADEGFGAIEVCGAFGPELAKEMYEATGRRVPVSYVVAAPDELEQVLAFWHGKETT